MSSRTDRLLPLLAIVLSAGCSAVRQGPNAATHNESASFAEQAYDRSVGSLNRSWQKVSGEDARPGSNTLGWDWVLAIPSAAPRAELVDTTLPGDALAHFVPQVQEHNIALVSATGQQPQPTWHDGTSTIIQVAEQPVKNWGQLHDAVEAVVAVGEPVRVVFNGPRGAHAAPKGVELAPATLVALTHVAAENEPLIRVSDGGNSSLVIHEDGIRCKLTARVEREAGILHLIVSLGAAWGEKRLLPAEIRAHCNGRPLRCLTVADTLELFYGETDKVSGQPVTEATGSFAHISEREDYLIASNYKRLEQANEQDFESLRSRPQPALAATPGVQYPGPAVLGDARALTSFLLQRENYEPSQPERVGWILFADESLRDGSEVDVQLDLGSGLRRIRFTLPSR